MNVSQKCQYALRALFELSKRYGQGPISVSEIADAQAIPPRFLEVILGLLRQGRLVESRRGMQGGYMLAADPRQLAVGEVIRYVDGPLDPVRCMGDKNTPLCPLRTQCVFRGMWERARKAVEDVYDTTTFQDLVDDEVAAGRKTADYCI